MSPARLLFFSAMRGHLDGEKPTETFEVQMIRGARLLEAKEALTAAGSTPLSCFLEAEQPRSDDIVQVWLQDSTRSVFIDASTEDATPAGRAPEAWTPPPSRPPYLPSTVPPTAAQSRC